MSVVIPVSGLRSVHAERVMGTVVSFDVRDGAAEIAIQQAVRWLHDVDARFSTYRADSEVARFGRGDLAAVSFDLAEVIAACDAITARSGGAFDAEGAAGFDPSAYVKGWSIDRVAGILRSHGCEDWSVNAGGDVLVSSAPTASAAWRIGVQHPFERDAVATVLHARDLAVATSGRYERGDHIVDPRTGAAATAAASSTVCGPELGLADAFATAAFVLGEEGPAWVAGLRGYECWTVLGDGRVLATPGFPTVVLGVPVAMSAVSTPIARAA